MPSELADELLEQEQADELCEFYAENQTALQAFQAMQTQWRFIAAGMGGFVRLGLEYASLPCVMDALKVPSGKRSQLFFDLRVMEGAALAVYSEQQASRG